MTEIDAETVKVQSKQVEFSGSTGDALVGSLDTPQNLTAVKYAIISHCFTCTRQTLTTARLSRGLSQAGYAVLRFDFTGLGDSSGDFAETNFTSMVQDIECAANFLAEHYQAPSILLGHSMGGTASLAASQNGAPSLAEVERLVTIASPAYPAPVLHHFGVALLELEQGRNSQIMVAGRAYPVRPGFIADVRSYNMNLQMQNCQLPVLSIRAGNDALVGPHDAQQILQFTQLATAADNSAGSRLVEIAQADHLFSDRGPAAQLLAELTRWWRNRFMPGRVYVAELCGRGKVCVSCLYSLFIEIKTSDNNLRVRSW